MVPRVKVSQYDEPDRAELPAREKIKTAIDAAFLFYLNLLS